MMRKRKISFLMALILAVFSVLPTGTTVYAEDMGSAENSTALETAVEELPVDVTTVMGTDQADEAVMESVDAEESQEDENSEEGEQVPGNDDQDIEIIEEAIRGISTEKESDYEVPEANEEMDLVISDVEVVGEELPIQEEAQSKTITSVKFNVTAPLSFTILNIIPGLQTIPVTVRYDDGTTEEITSWDFVNSKTPHWATITSTGDTLRLYGYEYFGGPIGIGTFDLTVSWEGLGDSASVTDSIPFTIEETELAELPESATLPVSREIYTGYSIPAQSSESVLKIVGSGMAQAEVALYCKDSSEYYMPMPYGSYNIDKSFNLDAGQDYVLLLRNFGDVAETVQFSVENKKSVQSVSITPKTSYNFFKLEEELPNLSAVVKYNDGTEQSIDGGWDLDWVEGDDGYTYALRHETDNSDLITVSLWNGMEKIRMDELLENDPLFGDFTLKVAVNTVRQDDADVTIQIDVAPTENEFPPKVEILPGQTKSYLISSADADQVVNIAPMDQILGEELEAILYRKESGRYLYEEKGYAFKIDAGKEYILVLKKEPWHNSSCTAVLSLGEKLAITSISITGIKESYDVEEDFRWDLNVHVVYGAEAYTADVDYGQLDFDDSSDCWYGETDYGETIIVESKYSDGVKVMEDEDFIVPGFYSLTAYVKGTEIQSETIIYEVTCTDMENIVLEKDYSVKDDADTYRDRYFSFTPSEDGEYVFSLLAEKSTEDDWGSCEVSLYDNRARLMGRESGEGLLTSSLKKGQTYYYVVGLYGSFDQAAIKLMKKRILTSATLESTLAETTFEMDEDSYIKLDHSKIKVRLHYSDGSSQVVEAKKSDQYGNFIDLWYCPFNTDGSPDLSRAYKIWFECDDEGIIANDAEWEDDPGTYALLAGVGDRDDDYNLVFEVPPVWVKIIIVPHGHVHSWNAPTVEVAPTCITEGKQSVYCSCGTMKPGSTTTVPKLAHSWKNMPTVDTKPTCITEGKQAIYCSICGTVKADSNKAIPRLAHSWSDWSIATNGRSVLSRTCSVCHTSETKSFSPVLKLTDKKLTMKTGQSTTKFKVTAMSEYDSLVSVKSSNTKILKVSNIAAKGTFKLKAQKKTGMAKLTITLKSGATKTIKVNVQKAKVKTTKIKVEKKKLTLKKKQKVKLVPVITPVTSYDKVKYTSSNKKVAVVSNKGQITAKNKGTATITVKSGKKKVQIKVTVK